MTTAATTNAQDAYVGLSQSAIGDTPEPHPELNGYLLKFPYETPIYLILDGCRCEVPDSQTFSNLFRSGAQVYPEPLLNCVTPGPALTPGAILAQAAPDYKWYLVNNELKRWIPSKSIADLYQFDGKKVGVYPAILLDSITSGDPIPTRG